MTKEITKANILQELQDKFKLREFEAENFLFRESVVPTYDIGPHVKSWVTERDRKPVSANGELAFHVIPDNEHWRVRKIDVYSETGGNFDIDQIFFIKTAADVQYVFFNPAAPIANGTVNIYSFVQDIPMRIDALKYLVINVSNFVAGGYISVHILKEVETVR